MRTWRYRPFSAAMQDRPLLDFFPAGTRIRSIVTTEGDAVYLRMEGSLLMQQLHPGTQMFPEPIPIVMTGPDDEPHPLTMTYNRIEGTIVLFVEDPVPAKEPV